MQSILCCGMGIFSSFGYAHLFNHTAISVSFETASAAVTSEFLLVSFCTSFQIIYKKYRCEMGFLSFIIKWLLLIWCRMANSRNEDIKKKRMAGTHFGKSQGLCTVASPITLSLYSKYNTYYSNILSVCSPYTDSSFSHFITELIQW